MRPSATTALAVTGALTAAGMALAHIGRQLQPQMVALDRRGMTVTAVTHDQAGLITVVLNGPAGRRTVFTPMGASVDTHANPITLVVPDPAFEQSATAWMDEQTPLDVTMHHTPAAGDGAVARTINLDSGNRRVVLHSSR